MSGNWPVHNPNNGKIQAKRYRYGVSAISTAAHQHGLGALGGFAYHIFLLY
jgi:hypothetical protein